MKKLSVFAVASMIAIGAFAASNEVTSVNAVGFIRTQLSAGSWELVSVPFESLDGEVSLTVSDLLPDVPNGTVVQVFRDGGWEIETKKPVVGWQPNELPIIRGDALFVQSPVDTDITIMGEVPSVQTAPETTTPIAVGFQMVGYAYPNDIALDETSLAIQAQNGSVLYIWNSEANGGLGGYELVTKKPVVGWQPAGVMLNAGQGYFVQAGNAFDWVETKLYDWP